MCMLSTENHLPTHKVLNMIWWSKNITGDLFVEYVILKGMLLNTIHRYMTLSLL